MKKVTAWGLYFLLCGGVIFAAIAAGKKHGHCHECEMAIDGKNPEKDKFAKEWLFND